MWGLKALDLDLARNRKTLANVIQQNTSSFKTPNYHPPKVDFDPRGGAGNSNVEFNALGDAKDNVITKPSDDGLADFSSTFSAPAASIQQPPQDGFDLFKAAPASLQPAPVAQDLLAGFSSAPAATAGPAVSLELFSCLAPADANNLGGLGAFNTPTATAPASSVDLLSGLAPAAANNLGGLGAFNSPTAAALAPSVDLLDGFAMVSLPPASMMQPHGLMLQPEGPPSLPVTGSSALNSEAGSSKPVSVDSTWQGIGGLNDSLLNIDLSKARGIFC